MKWTFVAIALGVAGIILFLKRAGGLDRAQVREHLRQGAKVIDVRTAAEYREKHLSCAVNIPLGELDRRIGETVPDKGTCLLLHCHGGGRSGVARLALKRMGYTRVYNLGSYGQAERLTGG